MYGYDYNINSNNNDDYLLLVVITIIIVATVVYQMNKKKPQTLYEEEQKALEETKRIQKEIKLKELKIKKIQNIITDSEINEAIKTKISIPGLSEDDILSILTDMYPECETEIKYNLLENTDNMDQMMQCFTDIERKKKLLIGHDECVIQLNKNNDIDVTINNINLKEIDIQDIISCIKKKNLEEEIKQEIEKEATKEVEEKTKQIFDDSKKQDNYINDEYTTARGVKYKVGALQRVDNIFQGDNRQKTATKCGTSQGVISVGYDITITHPDGTNETTICIFKDGVMEGNKLNQMEQSNDNTWYMYINDKNQCVDWGIYIPHNGHSEQLKKLEQTNKFDFYGAYDNSQRIKVKDIHGDTKYTVYYTKNYCEDVNQKRYVKWYYWNENKNTESCKKYNQYCCTEYKDGNYEHSAKDTDNVQFIRLDANRNTDKKRNKSKINLYQDEYTCNNDNTEMDTYKYNISTNTCTDRNNRINSNEMSKLNAGKHPINNVEDMYYSKSGCSLRIKKKRYVYDFDEATRRNKCIQLISDKCNTYGDSNMCNSDELNKWINETNFDRNKIYAEDGLSACKDKYERKKHYSFNVAENKCDAKILAIGASREERDSNGKLYYQSDDACEKANLKYITFDMGGCHSPETRTYNQIENTELLRKNKKGEIIKYKPYIKMDDSNGGKYGIISSTQIWDNGYLMPKYSKDYYSGMDKCREKVRDLNRLLQ